MDRTTTRLNGLVQRATGDGRAPLDEVLALFDDCPAVTIPEVLGSWRGSGLHTGHPLDGLLEKFGWHGKVFDSPDDAHPLIFDGPRGLFTVDPAFVPMGLVGRAPGLAHSAPAAFLGRKSLRAFTTRRPKARLRMVEYRGVPTATMIYDALPICDHFRAVDPITLLGTMDLRGSDKPFMFVLHREESTTGDTPTPRR